MNCYISLQIAKHCDEQETLCSECGQVMMLEENNILRCTCCDSEINLEEIENVL